MSAITSTAKHTPGPWSTQPCSHGGRVLLRGECGLHAQSHVQIAPNEDAYLIAAAPDLLDFVRKMHEQTYCICHLNAISGTSVECTTCETAALIAKAEGRQ